jgi:hypothetical protein
MVPRLEKLFQALESQRQSFLNEIRKYDAKTVYGSIHGQWNMAQVIAHLHISEKTSLDYLERKMLGIQQASNSSVSEWIKVIGLIFSQRLPFKYNAPRGSNLPEPESRPVDELVALWETERQRLYALLNRFEETDLKKKVYRHVVIGLVDVTHMMIFFREHIYHHQWQIKRLKKSAT